MEVEVVENLFSILFIGNLLIASLILIANLDKDSLFQKHVDWKYYLMTAMWGGMGIYDYLPKKQGLWFRVCVYINVLIIVAYLLLTITVRMM